ncbi:uncharacterized protein LOC135289102 [Passer domesticus]|uniref:uncharacterized protein LOC135289102 n=1 Tax=Passer domesticus TaxID=48849 RepID=UPI0030FE4F13
MIVELGIQIEVVEQEIRIKLCPLRLEDEKKINPEVWYSPDSAGRLEITPFKVTIRNPEIPVRIKQYPMSLEGRKGLKPEVDRLISQGLLEPCMSPYNTPILPVKKPNRSYRLVHDLREINKRTIARFPVVANPYTLLSKLSPDNHWYSVIDLKDAFWACPLDEASRDYFAFEWEDPETGRKQQLRWTVLPQGFTESPNLFGQALEQILENYKTDAGVTLIQYVDDLLLAGKEEEEVRRESLKVSRAKLQFVEEEVKYLGHYLRRGEKRIDPERVQAILSLPIPKNKRQIRQILGLTGYCRQWIENYSSKARFLYQKLTQDGLMKWTQEDTENLKELKESLVHAPVLSLPDLKRPFYLFVNIEGGVAFGVLTQEWADKKKPIAYLSKLLDPVSRGWPTCLQMLAGCALLVEEAKKITFNSSLKVYSPHNIRSVMQQKADKWISDARLLKYEGILLEAPNLTLETTAIQNPATFLFGSIEQEPLTHNCLITIEEQTKIRPDLEEEELDKGERLFVDGSSRVVEGKRQSGYAIIGGKGLQVADPIPPRLALREAPIPTAPPVAPPPPGPAQPALMAAPALQWSDPREDSATAPSPAGDAPPLPVPVLLLPANTTSVQEHAAKGAEPTGPSQEPTPASVPPTPAVLLSSGAPSIASAPANSLFLRGGSMACQLTAGAVRLPVFKLIGLLKVEEQLVPIATSTVHRRQYRTDRDAVIPIHRMIRELESQGVVSKTHSPFNSPIWPVRKSDGEWRLTVDYRALNEVTPPLSAAVPDMLELQYELESKYIDDIIVWGNTAAEVFEKGKRIIQILLESGFAIEKSKVKGPAREIQFLGVKWQDGRRQIPTEVINMITAMSPTTSKKETQAFLGAIGFWRMHIPEYSQIVSPLYLVTRKKTDFHWGPEQQQAFTQIKQEIAHAYKYGEAWQIDYITLPQTRQSKHYVLTMVEATTG